MVVVVPTRTNAQSRAALDLDTPIIVAPTWLGFNYFLGIQLELGVFQIGSKMSSMDLLVADSSMPSACEKD